MAHPMIESLLDGRYAACMAAQVQTELSVVVFGAMEATLTPLMERIEARFAGIKVFSLPSVDHPVHGRHIELGVKGQGDAVRAAYAALARRAWSSWCITWPRNGAIQTRPVIHDGALPLPACRSLWRCPRRMRQA
jgi:molybdopterin-biosynthesis enzyme MoeA-like protein